MIAEIISVGTELLMGQTVNKDAFILANKIRELGFDHYHQSAVGDNWEKLQEALDLALSRSDIVFTTGGLGPTQDDMTKQCVADFCKKDLVLDVESLNKIKGFMKSINRSFTLNNERQAYFPKDSIIMDNPIGTAPGCIVPYNGKHIIIFPGPPVELELMFDNNAREYLEKLNHHAICSEYVHVFNIGESTIEEMIKDLVENQTNPTIATYFSRTNVTIRITAKGNTKEEAKELVKPMLEKVLSIFGENIYEVGQRSMSQVVCDYLLKNNISISVAESCSGGLVSDALVQSPGISSVYKMGVVTYSNESKTAMLNVNEDTIKKYGAVSEQCAKEMAIGIKTLTKSDISLATTGIAGPTSDDSSKPVGLVYIALSNEKETIVKELHLKGDRERIRLQTVLHMFDMIRKYYKIWG